MTGNARDGTLIARTYNELKNDIIRGRLTPHEKLRVEHLKHDYDVSSGTLREALTMLMADRLVVAEGQRGFRVRSISPQELLDLNRIRVLLEKEAIRQAVECGDEDWEAGVVTAFHLLGKTTTAFANDPENPEVLELWEERHRAFHLALISASPSEWLRYFLSMAYQQYERYRHLFLEVARSASRGRDPHAEHTAIVDAVLARDGDLAATLVEQHISASIDEWAQYFEKVGMVGPDQAAAAEDKPRRKGRRTS
ncbi:FCD domain-containing protein [Novosphingobium malaysiense]|uniref:FCD domain-containing protein n=1 Tax=Novosphingobium malaysiense TaxID=1348853 RepID=UPI0018CE5344|nr:FCD domain-containing protein [Novosphingobium malaysiense]